MKKIVCILLCLFMVVGIFSGCSSGGGTIKIAMVGPMTGDVAEYGTGMYAAVQIAAEEWNEKGGILGKKIEILQFDDKNSSEEAAACAEKIAGDKSIVAAIGHFASGVAMTAAPTYQEANMAIISCSAAHPDYSKIGDCIFRNNPTYIMDSNFQLQVMKYLGSKKFGCFHPNSDAGASITKEMEARVAEYGDKFEPEFAITEVYNEGSVDFSAAIAKFIAAGVDTIYSSAPYSIIAPFTKQLKAKAPNIQIVGSSATFSEEFLSLGGEAVEGVIMPCSFFYESAKPIVKSFSDKYIEKFGFAPNTFSAQAYDAANAIFHAIEAGNSADRRSIVDNLYKVDFEGAAGRIRFDSNGDVDKVQVLLKIEGGKYVEIPDVMMSKTDWEAQLLK